MAYPDEILSLSHSKDGSPWVRVPARSGINSDDLSHSKDGSPWWAREIVSGAVSLNMYVGDVQVSKVYLGDTEVTSLFVGSTQI